MNPKELVVKCYAKQEEGIWVAVCLDFCLATQGDSLNEVKRKLEEQITFYVSEALEDKEYGNQLLGRRRVNHSFAVKRQDALPDSNPLGALISVVQAY